MGVDESRVQAIGRELFALTKTHKSGLFDTARWSGQILEWAMRDPAFKTEMFRFVDVFPVLDTPEAVARHITEYLLKPGLEVPAMVKLALKGARLSGLTARMASSQIEKNMRRMAGRFIAGQDAADALDTLEGLWKAGQAFTVDKLGEATVSETEADQYQATCLQMLDTLSRGASRWAPNPLLERDATGAVPRVNLSVKVSALYSQLKPLAFEASVAAALARLLPIAERAAQHGAFLNLDMEQHASKDIILALFRALLEHPRLAGWNDAGVVIQAYLRDSEADLQALIDWARRHDRRITVRLVKGAYWDYETVAAFEQGWPSPVWRDKADTDACFERLTTLIMKNHRWIRPAIGSHNLRSVAWALAAAETYRVPSADLEFQTLFGMAEPIRHALVSSGHRVRVYCPIGELIPGMAYLVRRLLENTSNESWLRLGYVEGRSDEELLAAPAPKGRSPHLRTTPEYPTRAAAPPPFVNEPMRDFSLAAVRETFGQAVARCALNRTVQPIIDGRPEGGDGEYLQHSPSTPDVVASRVSLATENQQNRAVATADAAFREWSGETPAERSDRIFALAHAMRGERDQLAALMCHESGKPWASADADVCEAIDFCEYYARQNLTLAEPRVTQALPGEHCRSVVRPRGVVAVIAPWNFPLAILAGMTTGPLVTGNTVVVKPAEQSSAIAQRFVELAHASGIPTGALQFLPGRGETIGAGLVSDPRVVGVAFTGSMAVGLDIWATAARTHRDQSHLRRVVCEMGGKNAIIVDDDADLDEAVLGVVDSAFGFSGQKCSACSRVIVLDAVYDSFVTRLVAATRSLVVGSATDPATSVGPVIDAEARQRLEAVIDDARSRLTVLESGVWSGPGQVVHPTIFGDVPYDDPIARDELFGPVLAVMRAATLDEAITLANDTRYALTAGIYSRSPSHIERAARELVAGNIYINRSITGAIVERHPFGGFKMSGGGTKAGGLNYLRQWVDEVVIAERTIRRGFTPDLPS